MRAVKIGKHDNVAVVIQDTQPGDIVEIPEKSIESLDNVPIGHKIAIDEIAKGDMIYKYDVVIGKSGKDIKVGEHVHTHNVIDITTELSKKHRDSYIKEGENR